MTKLILVHGLKYSGKSTIAEHLLAVHGYVRVKMADPLKNMTRSLLRDAGIPDDMIERYVEGDLKEAEIPELGGTTCRKIMMTLGDEWRNMHGRLLWANIAASKIEQHLSLGRKVIVDDIRYPFEIERLTHFNPLKLVVTRGDFHFQPYGEDRHPGERPMPIGWFHAHLRNDYETKEPLWSSVDRVLQASVDFEKRLADFGGNDSYGLAA